MNLIVASLITLGVIGCIAAIVLYFVAQKFKVVEDPRIDEVEAILPGVNCGGCGFPGCRGFADACVKADTLDGKLCPVGGSTLMVNIGEILGLTAQITDPMVAVLRCNGTCANRPRTSSFDGAKNCKITAQLYSGETGCSYGCTGFGDCVESCKFGAMYMDSETGLPVIDEEKCVACGACVKACPKQLIELRKKGIKSRRVFVACTNKEKGGAARKTCSAACIGCGKCQKECPFGAITIENNLAYIDFTLCKLCRKCVAVCPTSAILDINFPTPAPKPKTVVKEPQTEISKPKIEEKIQLTKSVVTPQVIIEDKQPKIVIAEPQTEKAVMSEESEIVVSEVCETTMNEKPQTAKSEEPKTMANEPQAEYAKLKVETTQTVNIPDNIAVSELIDPEFRITPREKSKEEKKSKTPTDIGMKSLDL